LPKMGEGHPIFAAVWSRMHKQVDRFRPGVVGPAHGHVLEVGAGGAENLRFYDLGDRVQRLTLAEPDPYMLHRAESEVRRTGLPVKVVQAAAEELPFPSGSFDTVVATLVFCSVEDQSAALAEVRRVLKPGGAFLFMEHVRSEHPVWSRFQDIATPVNRVLGAGCRLNRDTIGAIDRAGFEVVRLSRVQPQFPLFVGTAIVR
jgi:ubiquinone/menaquinone biosynthesis C-methylase UbiE